MTATTGRPCLATRTGSARAMSIRRPKQGNSLPFGGHDESRATERSIDDVASATQRDAGDLRRQDRRRQCFEFPHRSVLPRRSPACVPRRQTEGSVSQTPPDRQTPEITSSTLVSLGGGSGGGSNVQRLGASGPGQGRPRRPRAISWKTRCLTGRRSGSTAPFGWAAIDGPALLSTRREARRSSAAAQSGVARLSGHRVMS